MKFMTLVRDKRFRYGTMSTAMMIFAIVIFVLVNLLADEFNESWDLTAEQLYTLSAQSHNFLDDLEVDVTLYYVQRTGAESHLITRLFEEYSAASNRVTTEFRDPMISPTFVHQFMQDDMGIPDGSVIVESAQGFRVIRPHEMRTIGRNPQNPMQTFIESIDAERQITSAMHTLTLGEPTVVYHIMGSGEQPLTPAFVEFLESENFELRQHDALFHDIPETADALFITMPARDWSTPKADRILDYLNYYEGRVFMALDVSVERFNDGFPELDRVLHAYGLRLEDYIILEGDAQHTFMGDPLVMLPVWEQHEEIILPIAAQFTGMLLLQPAALEILDTRRTTVNIEPLLSTTRAAYGRRLDSDAETLLQTPDDTEGPFPFAVAIEEHNFVETNLTMRMVVVSNSLFMNENVNDFVGGANWAFVSNSLNWLQDQPAGIWVPVRRPPGGRLPVMISDGQVLAMSGIAMGALPVISFAVGIFIWFRRRHS